MLRRLTGAVLLGAFAICSPAWATPVDLTILHTNDTHDHLAPFKDRNGQEVGGVARRATLIRQVRQQVPNLLVLDAGDCFQGTPIFTFFGGEPDYKAMRMMGYDGIAVGNHDLDNGLDHLLTQAKLLEAPPLSSNLLGPDGRRPFAAWRMVERGGLKIALVGVLGLNAFEAVANDKRRGLSLADSAETLKALVPQLRKQADLVILLSHSGHEEEVALASRVAGIDVIIGGHSHTKVEKPVVVTNGGRPTLVVQAFQWGEYLGRIDLTVDHGRIEKYAGSLLPVSAALAPDPAVAAMVDQYARQIAEKMNQVVGQAAIEFANSHKSEGDTPLGNLIADVLRAQGGTEVAIMNSGGIRAGLPAGPITRGAVFSMLPFENRLVTLKLQGRQLQKILDFSASRTGQSGTLQVSGLSFAVDGPRAVDVKVGGQPLAPERTYTVTTIDYLASGNDGAGAFKEATALTVSGRLLRDVFVDYLAAHPRLEAPPGGRIRVLAPHSP